MKKKHTFLYLFLSTVDFHCRLKDGSYVIFEFTQSLNISCSSPKREVQESLHELYDLLNTEGNDSHQIFNNTLRDKVSPNEIPEVLIENLEEYCDLLFTSFLFNYEDTPKVGNYYIVDRQAFIREGYVVSPIWSYTIFKQALTEEWKIHNGHLH